MTRTIALILTLFSVTTLGQDDLQTTGVEGLEKRSWVLMDTSYTVRGERSIEVPQAKLEGKDINYVAFYVKNQLVFVDEIPPFSLTYNFGDFTQKARIVAVGVKYRYDLPQPAVAEVSEQVQVDTAESMVAVDGGESLGNLTGEDAAEQETFTATGDEVSIVAPTSDQYTYGVATIGVEIMAPAEAITRVDFFVDGNLAGSVESAPWQLQHDFGRGFNEQTVRVVAFFSDGSTAEDEITTTPLEQSDFYVRSRLVTFEATVVDWRDRIITDLSQDDFRIWEDGAEQEITHFSVEERPIRVALVIDISSSMQEKDKMQRAITSAQQFLQFLNPEKDMAALILFNEQPYLISEFTNDFISIKNELDKVQPMGGTAISDTLAATVPLFKDQIGRKAIVLVTDGIDQHSNIGITEAVEQVRAANAKIYSVGIYLDSFEQRQLQENLKAPSTRRGKDPGVDPTDARKKDQAFTRGQDSRQLVFEGLADASGGAAFFPETLRQLPLIFQRIADELRNSYSIGYVPSNKDETGRWRDVDIEVNRSGLTVKAKDGYVDSEQR